MAGWCDADVECLNARWSLKANSQTKNTKNAKAGPSPSFRSDFSRLMCQVDELRGFRRCWIFMDPLWILWILCSVPFVPFAVLIRCRARIAGIRHQLQRRRWRGAACKPKHPKLSLPRRASLWYQFPGWGSGWCRHRSLICGIFVFLIWFVALWFFPSHQVKICLALNRRKAQKKISWYWKN